MAEFSKFSVAAEKQFRLMSQYELFVVGVDGNEVWDNYLSAFPEGENPIYRERTEHDCSCCKNFIRNIGNVVAMLDDGSLVSVWDVAGLEYPYDVVAARLSDIVKGKAIASLFRTKEGSYGNEHTKEQLPDGTVKRWHHFHATIAAKHKHEAPATIIGDYATTVQVFERGLKELSADAFDTVIDLIGEKALYRGDEFLAALKGFQKLQKQYKAHKPSKRTAFVWTRATDPSTRFRNTAMGTLIQDLSEGMELDKAVRSFEAKVAPTNYKRPTALITKGMIDQAMKTIKELDLESALDRRMAKISDVSVNNVLWADGSVRGQMKGGIEGLLLGAVHTAKTDVSKATDISIDEFVQSILPGATSLDLLVKNAAAGKFVTITAPVHEGVSKLFKWDNDFAWSYDGNITDSIKERVKKAGGSVVGDLCCRLAWDYRDDLDFHMYEPDGSHIYFSKYRRTPSPNGGMLDLDANGADGLRDDPAENIYYANHRTMREGVYSLVVHNYNRRSAGVGFTVEIEFDGQLYSFNYPKALSTGKTVSVADIHYSKRDGFSITEGELKSSQASRKVWGVDTEQFVKVNTVMMSPNYWDSNAVGNKHWFFLLEGCKNPEAARGIYNEFLKPSLDKHRKVFEVLGNKTKCEPTEDQLSGVGFSSTQKDSVVVRVSGPKINKLYNINF